MSSFQIKLTHIDGVDDIPKGYFGGEGVTMVNYRFLTGQAICIQHYKRKTSHCMITL